MKELILTLSGQRAAGCVECAHGLRDLFYMDTSLGRITCLLLSGLATLLSSLKICCFLFPISFYLGTFAQTGMLAFQTRVPLFVSLCRALHSGPCAVSQQCSGVGGFSRPESLLSWPYATYGVYSTACSIYSDAASVVSAA